MERRRRGRVGERFSSPKRPGNDLETLTSGAPPPPATPPLTVHYVEYERQHGAAGGGVRDVHGVLANVQLQRVLVQQRLVPAQVLQGDDAP